MIDYFILLDSFSPTNNEEPLISFKSNNKITTEINFLHKFVF